MDRKGKLILSIYNPSLGESLLVPELKRSPVVHLPPDGWLVSCLGDGVVTRGSEVISLIDRLAIWQQQWLDQPW